MKKRVLSFLVACVMVVSTFIISKPLVHVHAVDGDTNFVEGENQWTMPYNWHENLDKDAAGKYDLASKQNGIWRLTSFNNPDDFATMTWNDTHERSYVESVVNRGIGSGASAAAGWTGWYISARHRWNGGSIFSKGDNSTWMKVAMTTVKSGTYQVDENGEYVLVKDNKGNMVKVDKGIGYVDSYSKNPAVVFTAPEAGTYSYSELVTANNLLDDSNLIDARDTAKRFAVNVTVRKEGKVIDSFLLDEDQESKTLEGTVALAKGERLAFVFSMITDNAKLGKDSTAETSRYALKLSDVVVKKIGEYPANGYAAKVDLTPRFEVGSYTDKLGNVTLMGCNITTKELYPIKSYVTETNNNSWLALDPLGKHGTNYSLYGNNKGYNLLWGIDKETGLIMAVGGAQLTTNTGSALVFEAPYDGTFSFEVMMTSCYPYAKNNAGVENFRYHDFTIAKEDGTILVTKHNEGATAKHASVTISAAAELKAGEKVIITKTPHANGATQFNASCNGNATVSIYEVEHICSAGTVNPVEANDANCVEGGNVAYYACSCGTNFADADATEVIADVNTPVDEDAHAPAAEWTTDDAGHWHVCNNNCGEKLSYAEHNFATGTCVCGKACPHDWSKNDGVCADCGIGCPAHDMKNAEGKCANCGMTHTHDADAADANCQNAAVCSICGYEVAPINAEKHGEISYVANENKTHKVVCEFGCVIDEDAACVLDENNVCKDCKYDYTVEIAADNFSEVFDSVFNGGETDHVAEGPAEGALNNSGAVKGEDVNGFTYGGFNLEMNETIGNTVKLRHHILLDGNLTVKVNGEEVVLTNVSGNYYYFEVEVEIGKFSEAHTITVGETTVVTASVHSYMKTAFEADEKNPDALTDAQENLLKALYDWDYAVANK